MPGPIFTFGDYLHQRYPFPVHKVTVNAGFTCPNRDGSKGRGGCTFCNNKSFNPQSRRYTPDIESQIMAGADVVYRRRRARHLLAYFQAYSNTYADLSFLESVYTRALRVPGVIGLVVGTRPDCVTDAALDLLARLHDEGLEVWVEYGLQSAHDVTLQRINRGHTFAEYHDTVRRTRARGLPVCTHLMLGLPGENEAMMLETLDRVRETGCDGLKLHPLHIVRHTMMAHQWRKGEISVLAMDEYIDLVCKLLARTPADWVIHRLTGTASEDMLLSPSWCSRKWQVINGIYEAMRRRGLNQGAFLSTPETRPHSRMLHLEEALI